ncbi:MAG: hypothetical protein KDD41_10405 [Flavobacteriales bacterium]|nr:hypothetical protein [Flavobacteriales bacterium]
MKKILLFIITAFLATSIRAQSVTELYQARDFRQLIEQEKNADELTPEELYMVGYAFFQLENDDKAIAFYDKAIEKGYDNGSVYFYKGLSLGYLEKYDEALKQIDIALEKEPTNQEYMNHKGELYRYQGKEDIALEYYVKATQLPNTIGDPFFWVAYVYHGKQELKKALSLYYEAVEIMPQSSHYYVAALHSIGQLEYTYTQNYSKSAQAYAQAININPKDYEYYPKLIKAYNGAGEFAKADSIFSLLKVAYINQELSEEDQKFGNTAVDESEWNGQKLIVYRYFDDPKESLDISYKVYLLAKGGDKVERTFMVEQTLQLPDGPKHLLCEKDRKTDTHITYPYGWKSDAIPLDNLKKAVVLVLDGKMKQGASSTTGKRK